MNNKIKAFIGLFLFIFSIFVIVYILYTLLNSIIQTDSINIQDTNSGIGPGKIDLSQDELDAKIDSYKPPPDTSIEVHIDPYNPPTTSTDINKDLSNAMGHSFEAIVIGSAIQIHITKDINNLIVRKIGKIPSAIKSTIGSLRNLSILKAGRIGAKETALAKTLVKDSSSFTTKTFNAINTIKTMTIIGAGFLIFDIINMVIDVNDVDGYSNVSFKETYIGMKKEYDKMVSELTKDVKEPIIAGPLDNIPLDILTNKLVEYSLIYAGPRINELTESYIKYIQDNNITSEKDIDNFITKRLEIDLNMDNIQKKSFELLCTQNNGIIVGSSSGEQYCSYSESFCKPYKAYSWPLNIDSTEPVITTSQYTKDLGTYYVGSEVVISGLIDKYTDKDQIGTITDISKLDTGIVTVTFTDDSIEDPSNKDKIVTINVSKDKLKAVYSDTYVEWKGNACVVSSPFMRNICYGDGLNYDISTGICVVDETYCRSKAYDWKFNPAINTFDCHIGFGQEIYRVLFGITFTSKMTQIFDMNQYEKCKSNEIDAGYQCSSCPDGYSMDNLANAYLQKSIEIGKLTAEQAANTVVGVPIAAAAGIVVGLASGFNTFLNSFCYKECPKGMYSVGPVCWQECPPGFSDYGVGCLKPASCGKGVGITTPVTTPDILSCPEGTKDAAGSCWIGSDIKPGYDPAGRYFNGTCKDSSEKIATLCYEKCPEGHERDGLLCYPKCKPGYHKVGCCVCSPDCPPGTTDNGLFCTKHSVVRDLKFVLPRTKNRIVPFSTKQVTPITTIVDNVNPTGYSEITCPSGQVFNPEHGICVSIECPEGKTYNPWLNQCLNTCPDPSYERFNGRCYRNCDSIAKDKPNYNPNIKYAPDLNSPGICNPICPDGTIQYGNECLNCGPDEYFMGDGCYKKCPAGTKLGYEIVNGINKMYCYTDCPTD